MAEKTIVVALGGNAVVRAKQKGTYEEQLANVTETCRHIVGMIKLGYRVIVTHGNGPQVGAILLQNEAAKDTVPAMPLDVCGAESQGFIGYMLQRVLRNELKKAGVNQPTVTLITQVVVDEKDPAFDNPTKPVGPFYKEAEAKEHMKEKKWAMVEDSGRGWRRVVPSPDPVDILEKEEIKQLVESDVVVIAAGGGGIPVIRKPKALEGTEAVIDKDLAAERLAAAVKADMLIILTDVEKVAVDYGKPSQKWLDSITLAEAQAYHDEGQFPPGSMGPKMLAAIRFLKNGGERVIITKPESARDALRGKTGTHITR
jgi:carbamate kinase